MGGFITAGLTGPLVTVGFGAETVVVVQEREPTPGGGLYLKRHKRRVQGMREDRDSKLQVLQTLTSETEIPINVLLPSFKEYEYRAKLVELIKRWTDSKANIKVSIITKVSETKARITEHYVDFHDNKVIITARLANLIDKAVHIHESRTDKKQKDANLISVDDILDDVEKTEIVDLVKELEKLDDRRDRIPDSEGDGVGEED